MAILAIPLLCYDCCGAHFYCHHHTILLFIFVFSNSKYSSVENIVTWSNKDRTCRRLTLDSTNLMLNPRIFSFIGSPAVPSSLNYINKSGVPFYVDLIFFVHRLLFCHIYHTLFLCLLPYCYNVEINSREYILLR